MTKYNHAEFHLTKKRAEIDAEERRLIDAEERRLIDEAVAAGKVQKIPTGKSAFAVEYVWQGDESGRYEHSVGKLVPKNPVTRAEALARFKAQNLRPRNIQVKPEVLQRRAEVLRMYQEGYETAQIADHLGVTVKTIRNHKTRLIELGKLEKGASNGKMTLTQMDERREQVRQLIKSGLKKKEICEQLCITSAEYNGDRSYLAGKGLVPRRTIVNGNEVCL